MIWPGSLAYIDPGTGSILLQCLIGSVVGATIMFRQMFTWPWRAWRRSNKNASRSAPPFADDSL